MSTTISAGKMTTTFFPPKRNGLIFHAFTIVFFTLGSILSWEKANQVEVGDSFLIYLLAFLLFTFPIPLVAYRAYALLRGSYHLKPERIILKWGLRSEEIPMDDVLWVSPENELDGALPIPWLHWPGAVIGTRRLGERGEVEYMSASSKDIIVIATQGKVYAISPENPDGFIKAYQRVTELGSLDMISGRSIHPSILLGDVWASRPARYIIIVGLGMSLGLLSWVILAIPNRSEINFSIRSGDETERVLTAAQLLLLPIANVIFFLVDLLLGFFFFRHPQRRPLSYVLWSSSLITSILFFCTLYIILQN